METFKVRVTNDDGNINKEIITNGMESKSIMPNNLKRVFIAFIVSFAMVIVPIAILSQIPIDNISFMSMLIITGIYSVLYLIGITLVGEWAAITPPAKGVQPIDREELINSLKNLSFKIPVDVIEKQDGKIIFKWRYVDQRFKYLFGLGKISGDYTLALKIPKQGKSVYASETIKKFSMEAGGLLSLKPQFDVNFSYFHGISLFTNNYSKGYGFTIEDGKLVFDNLYEYKFNPDELKAVIVTLITTSGWKFQPKVFLF